MKKLLFILTLTLNFNAYAASEGWKDCDEDGTAACEYQIKNGVLTVRGTGENGAGTIPDYERDCSKTRSIECTTTSPFRWDEDASSIHTVNIQSGITSIGNDAFEDIEMTTVNLPDGLTSISGDAFMECTHLSNINFPNGLTSIGGSAFSATNLKSIIIPDTVTEVGSHAFNRNTALESIVIGENTMIDENALIYRWDVSVDPVDFHKFKMYCATGNTSCESAFQKAFDTAKILENLDSTASASDYLITYTKASGFYQIGDSLYANADLMTHGAACDDAANCQTILDAAEQGKPFEVGGKYYATLDLFANGAACTDKKNCEDILSSNGNPFKVGSKIYNSMADFANGNNIKFRIYTIDEANAVAGTKNRVSIRYR